MAERTKRGREQDEASKRRAVLAHRSTERSGQRKAPLKARVRSVYRRFFPDLEKSDSR